MSNESQGEQQSSRGDKKKNYELCVEKPNYQETKIEQFHVK